MQTSVDKVLHLKSGIDINKYRYRQQRYRKRLSYIRVLSEFILDIANVDSHEAVLLGLFPVFSRFGCLTTNELLRRDIVTLFYIILSLLSGYLLVKKEFTMKPVFTEENTYLQYVLHF
jgi:hypothetical protein